MQDSGFSQRDILIAFRNLFGDHTGEALASVTADVLSDYDVAKKLHCFVGDNATNNDETYSSALNLRLGLSLDGSHRIRCTGHIINLVVKAIIYGKGVSKFEEEVANAAPRDQFELFRKKGPVGRLHNFVNAVLASHKRREAFLSLQRGLDDDDPLFCYGTLNLVQDGGIRWNSVYLMILRCIELRHVIERFPRYWVELTGTTQQGKPPSRLSMHALTSLSRF
jgi:predicted nucleotidyltransferase